MRTLASIHRLPGADAERLRDLDARITALQPGEQVRVTWKDEDGTTGVVEGVVRRPSHLTNTLFVGHHFCLHARGYANVTITDVETRRRPDFDIDQLAERMGDWAEAVTELENTPVGRFKTGDNSRQQNAVQMAREYVVAYLKSVTLR